jgi:hypothetical protein
MLGTLGISFALLRFQAVPADAHTRRFAPSSLRAPPARSLAVSVLQKLPPSLPRSGVALPSPPPASQATLPARLPRVLSGGFD